jgi:hypothetical protein
MCSHRWNLMQLLGPSGPFPVQKKSTSHTGQDWLNCGCWCPAILVLRLLLWDADSQLEVTKSPFGARVLGKNSETYNNYT